MRKPSERQKGGASRRAGRRPLPPSLEEPEGRSPPGIQTARRRGLEPRSGPKRTFPEADEPPLGPQSFEGTHEEAGAGAFPVHPRPFKERHEERPDRPNTRDTSPHRGEVVPGFQSSAGETPLQEEGQCHRTLRRLQHPQALGTGLSQRHPDLAGDLLRAGLPRRLPERRPDHPLPHQGTRAPGKTYTGSSVGHLC